MNLNLKKNLIFLIIPIIFLVSCTSTDLTSLEEGTYFGSINELDSSYVKYEDNKLFYSIYGDLFSVFKKIDDELTTNDDGTKLHSIYFEQDYDLQKELKNGYKLHEAEKTSPDSVTLSFSYDTSGNKSPSIMMILSDDSIEDRDLKNSKFSVILAEEIPESEFPSIVFKNENTEEDKNNSNSSSSTLQEGAAVYEEKTGNMFRLDGMESEYTYESSLIKNAIVETSKLTKIPVDNNYLVEENEIGELYISVYSLDVQDEIIESYIFDPYTKIISSEKNYGLSSNSAESVSQVINEAIAEVERQTSYSNQFPYVLSGFVTDDDLIAINISISDENNPGESIVKDIAIYDPVSKSLVQYPKNDPINLTEDTITKETISFIEGKTGYIEGQPYIYYALISEDGPIVDIEIRAPGAGDSGTFSIVDIFQYNYNTEELWIYNSIDGRYTRY